MNYPRSNSGEDRGNSTERRLSAHEVAISLLEENPERYGETLQELFTEAKVPDEEELQELIDAFEEAGLAPPYGLKRQKDERLTEVFVKVFNLRKEEIENEELIENIKNKVRESLNRHPSPSLVPDDFPFSFHWDPSVTSGTVLMVEVNFFPVEQESFEDAEGLASYLGDAVWQAFDEEEVEERSRVWASLPQLGVLF